VDADALALRRRIVEAFAAAGAPPALSAPAGSPALSALVERHVVVLGDDGEVVMAHPFAGHRRGARVEADDHTWWGNCAWDALGIVAALDLREARIVAGETELKVVDGTPRGELLFHVLVPARHWWDDIGFT
jgi:hypothetical protein